MNAICLLERLSTLKGTKEKTALLAQADEVAKKLFVYALDPYRTYGLQNIQYEGNPARTKEYVLQQTALGPGNADRCLELECEHGLIPLLDGLASRDLTGNEARVVVNQYLAETDPAFAKWFHRVLIKDLDCGVSTKTINKVFPDLIPSFSVQLAEDAKDRTDFAYPVWCDYKLDGIRVICIKDGSSVELFTRNGKALKTLPTIADILRKCSLDFVLDGEMMSRSWNDTQSAVFSTKNTVNDEAMIYNVFDAMPLAEWFSRDTKTPYQYRRSLAVDLLTAIGHERVRLVGGEVVHNKEKLQAFYQKALAAGYEGVMVKDLKAPYQFKRSKSVMKIKPHATWEGTIVGWEKGDSHGKWKDSFGAFVVRFTPNGPTTSVGGGYSDDLRAEITENLMEDVSYYNGHIIEVKGQEMTKDGVIRFPVFVRFRSIDDT